MITGAILRKPTGKSCGDKAFKKELSCPLCDTVLAKDGVAEITLQPDENDLTEAAANVFGFDPQQMCRVLQLGLDFWAKQKNNETLKHIHDMKVMKKKLEDADAHNAKLMKVSRMRHASCESKATSYLYFLFSNQITIIYVLGVRR